MTYGTLGYGFFRNSVRFRQNILYWHFMPSCTELGFACPGKSLPESLESFNEGIRIQDHLVFAGAAAVMAASKSP